MSIDFDRFVVVDGKFIKTDQLVLNGSVPVAPAHVIFGWMADDGVDFQGNFPTSTTTEAEDITTGIGLVFVKLLVVRC